MITFFAGQVLAEENNIENNYSHAAMQSSFSLRKDWEILQDARRDYQENRHEAAKEKFLFLYHHHNLFSIPFLEALEVTVPSKNLPSLACNTPTARSFFQGEDLILSNDEKVLLLTYEKKADDKIQFFIINKLNMMQDTDRLHWLDFASNMGHIPSQVILGLGMGHDSFTWLERSAAQCDQSLNNAKAQLAYIPNMTPGRIYYSLGMLYFHGNGSEKDPAKLIEYFKKSADENFPWACLKLPEMVESFPSSITTSLLETLEKLSEKNIIHAQLALCKLLLEMQDGSNKEKKIRNNRIRTYLKKAYQEREGLGLFDKYFLGKYFLVANSCTLDEKTEGFSLLKELSRCGVDRENILQGCRQKGIGNLVNKKCAIEFYEKYIAPFPSSFKSFFRLSDYIDMQFKNPIEAAIFMSLINYLDTQTNQDKSIQLFHSLKESQDERVANIAKIMFYPISQLKPAQPFVESSVQIVKSKNSPQEPTQNILTRVIEQSETTAMVSIVKKPTKTNLTKTEKKLARIKDVAPEVKTVITKENPIYPVIIFSDSQKKALESFLNEAPSNMPPRKLERLLKIFNKHGLYETTKKGFQLKFGNLRFSTHTAHADTIDEGALKDLIKFVKNVVQTSQSHQTQ